MHAQFDQTQRLQVLLGGRHVLVFEQHLEHTDKVVPPDISQAVKGRTHPRCAIAVMSRCLRLRMAVEAVPRYKAKMKQ
jgi:hypothetical protein